jgi:serine phosphatase RsbU (regulator of sigma subunit)
METHDERPPDSLLPDELALLDDVTDCLALQPGDVVVRENEPGRRMFVLLEGELVVTVKGHEIDRLSAGTVFGEMAMIDSRPRSATVSAVSAGRLVALDRDGFRDLVRKAPEFALRVMAIMSHRLRRMTEDESQRLRMEEELAVGRRIQLAMLPASCPAVDGWQFAAAYKAAREVGGDLYDFVIPPADPQRLHIAIADVTGKGVPAALFMAVGRTILRMEALDLHTPAQALSRVNRFVVNDVQSRLFMSAFVVQIDGATGRVLYANAGHNPPYWLRAGSGSLETLSAPGLVVGAFDFDSFSDRECHVAPGDFLVFFTDGITEARNAGGDFLDEEGLEALLASRKWSDAGELLRAIVERVEAFAGDAEQADDYTVVIAHRLP